MDSHNHFDGIKVLLTSEAAGEVGPPVGGGMEFAAKRAEKAQVALRIFEGELQNGSDKIVNVDLVSKRSQEYGREAKSSHFSLSFVA